MEHPEHQRAAAPRTGLWRKLEWAAAGLSLFIVSGAVFPLLMLAPDEILDDAERARLRLLQLPCYAITILLLSRHRTQLVVACLRNLPMLLLLAMPMVSALWSISGSLTLRREFALLMSMLLALLLVVRFSPRQQMLLFGGLLGLLTALSMMLGVVAPGMAHAPGESALRGLFVHKNVLGWVASLSVCFALAMLQDALRGIRRLGLLLLATGLAGTLMSESMTSLVAASVAMAAAVVFTVIAQRRGAARLVLGIIAVQVAIILVALLASFYQPLLEAMGKDATLTGRVPLWRQVDPWILERPLLGYGYGAFWSDADPIAWQIWSHIGWKAPHAHNGYRDLMLNFGLVGAAVFALAVLQAAWRAFALLAAEPGAGWLWCNVVIVVSLFLNLSESTFLVQNDLIWLLVSTAMMTVSYRHAALAARLQRHSRIGASAI